MSEEKSIQFKPVIHLREYGWENGERVSVERPPAPTPSIELLYDLRDGGATFPDDAAAVAAIERAFDAVGFERAADALKWIIARLGKDSAAGIELDKLLRRGIDSLRDQTPESKVRRWLSRFKMRNVNTIRE